MADEETTVDETTTDTTAAGSETGKDGQPFDAARAQSTIENLRTEVKNLKATSKEVETLRAKVTEHERAALSETERKDAELADLKSKVTETEQRYQNALVQTAIEREAMKANAIDPDVVFQLIDRSTVTFDADGRVTGADKAVATLLKDKPYLVKSENGNGTRSVPATGKPGQPAGRTEMIADKEKQLKASGRYAPL